MMDCLHGRPSSNIHRAPEAHDVILEAKKVTASHRCLLTSHHTSLADIPDSLGGPGCKLALPNWRAESHVCLCC